MFFLVSNTYNVHELTKCIGVKNTAIDSFVNSKLSQNSNKLNSSDEFSNLLFESNGKIESNLFVTNLNKWMFWNETS